VCGELKHYPGCIGYLDLGRYFTSGQILNSHGLRKLFESNIVCAVKGEAPVVVADSLYV